MSKAKTTKKTALGEPKAFTVRDAMYDLMARFGMTRVFGNPGSTELPMFRDFPEAFQYVLGLQEAVVVGMADGYAQATRNAALINLHSAAGVGNAMGTIFTAWKNRTPLVITAGQQARSILPFDPYLASREATELAKPYVKWSIEPARAEDVPLAIARGYYIAMTPPRGPVLISVPVDDWDRPAAPVPVREVARSIRPDPAMIQRIGAALEASQRPAFVMGGAVDRDAAMDAAVALAERYEATVFTAPMSGRCAFPEHHRLFAGFLPAMREKIVEALAGHDVIVVIGAPVFTYHIEGFGPHAPEGATLFQLTEDPQTAAWPIVGDAAIGCIRLGVEDLLARARVKREPTPVRRPPAERLAATRPMSAAYVLQQIAELRPAHAVVVEEAPSSRSAMQRHLPITQAEGFYTMDSGGLGYSMPAAVGVALGKPSQKILCIMGDGSTMYSPQAIWSAAQLGSDITFIILKNGGYNALKQFSSVFGFGPNDHVQGTDLPNIDFVALAQAQGCAAISVSDPTDLDEALRTAFAARGPKLIEITIA